VRFLTTSAADFLENYFEDELIRAAMASPEIIGLDRFLGLLL
jgi:phytoene dehydrogenase-like protein